MSAPATVRGLADRPTLLTLAQLDTIRARHLANAAECWRRSEQHPLGSAESNAWAGRAVDHGHWAARLRDVRDHRTRRYGAGPLTAGLGVFP